MQSQGLTTRRITGLAGLGVVVLFGVGNALWAFEQPDAGAPAREVVAFYAGTSSEIIIGGSLSLFAIALFILFASGVRAILREHENEDVLATVAFGGALLAMAAGLGAETINMVGAMRADAGQLTPELGRTPFEVGLLCPRLQRRRCRHRHLCAGDCHGRLALPDALAALALASPVCPRGGGVHYAALPISDRSLDPAAGGGISRRPQTVKECVGIVRSRSSTLRA
jgi:hypothetical protein